MDKVVTDVCLGQRLAVRSLMKAGHWVKIFIELDPERKIKQCGVFVVADDDVRKGRYLQSLPGDGAQFVISGGTLVTIIQPGQPPEYIVVNLTPKRPTIITRL